MNDKHKEQLSAFIDNEVGPNELSELEADNALMNRYQLMGDAIKGDLCDASFVDVSAQVSAAIESEPTHSVAQIKTTQKSSSTQSWFNLSAWLRPVGGMAVAASVAIVMVLVVTQPENSDIGISGAGGQIATDSRPVVSLPVSNVSHSIMNNKKETDEELNKKNNTVITLPNK